MAAGGGLEPRALRGAEVPGPDSVRGTEVGGDPGGCRHDGNGARLESWAGVALLNRW